MGDILFGFFFFFAHCLHEFTEVVIKFILLNLRKKKKAFSQLFKSKSVPGYLSFSRFFNIEVTLGADFFVRLSTNALKNNVLGGIAENELWKYC
jgi:hypothetical protein